MKFTVSLSHITWRTWWSCMTIKQIWKALSYQWFFPDPDNSFIQRISSSNIVIYGNAGHLGQYNWTIWTKFLSPNLWMFYFNFGLNWPSSTDMSFKNGTSCNLKPKLKGYPLTFIHIAMFFDTTVSVPCKTCTR